MSRVSINVNDLSMVHRDSGGVSNATLPDVCITPVDMMPVPFPNVARSSDLQGGSSLVTADGGNSIALAGSVFAKSTGDEPGRAGGVTSGVHGKEATLLSHSFDVRVEGRGVARLTDKMLHNRGNTIDCAGIAQAVALIERPIQEGDDRHRLDENDDPAPWETPLQPSKRGVDTNNRTLDMKYAHHRHTEFVCRYISGHTEQEATDSGILTQSNVRLSLEEAHRIGIDLVACWEYTPDTTNIGPNHRSIEAGSLQGQRELGQQDAAQADANLSEAGGEGQPIYFTVDFPVGEKVWKNTMIDVRSGATITIGDVIIKYFQGINDVLPIERIGVYGRYTAVKYIMEFPLARYGWQMTFNSKVPYPAAHIHQTSIYPDLQRWGPELPKRLLPALKNPDAYEKLPPGNDKDLVDAAAKAYHDGLLRTWHTEGAGGLDFDRAVKADFGQWRPGVPPPPWRKPKKKAK